MTGQGSFRRHLAIQWQVRSVRRRWLSCSSFNMPRVRPHRRLMRYHPRIGQTYIPGLRARVPHPGGGYLVTTNAQGFRCRHDFEPGRSAGVKRALLFGDSFTAGDAVSNRFRYGDLLEERVAGLEVYNFGLPGTGTDQHFLAFEEFARDVEYDLAIIAVLVENIRRVAARYRASRDRAGNVSLVAKPFFTLSGDRLELGHVPVPKRPLREDEVTDGSEYVDRGGRLEPLRLIVRRLGLKDVVQRATRYQPVPAYDDRENRDWRLMRAILRRWISGIDAPVILMPIPLYHFVEETADPSGYRARFKELADETGALLHDPLDDLLKHSPGTRRAFRFENDVHPTRAGHAALAASLAPSVARALDAPRTDQGRSA